MPARAARVVVGAGWGRRGGLARADLYCGGGRGQSRGAIGEGKGKEEAKRGQRRTSGRRGEGLGETVGGVGRSAPSDLLRVPAGGRLWRGRTEGERKRVLLASGKLYFTVNPIKK